MRFNELRHGGDRPFVLDLHPRLTLLTGLGDDGRRWIAELLQRALRGELHDIGGTVDVHGVERQLTDALVAELALPADLDIVVRPADLPGARTVVPEALQAHLARESDGDAETAPLPDLRAIANELAQASHALARAAENRAHTERLLAGSLDALAPEATDVAEAEARLADARRRRAEAAAALESVVRAAPGDDRHAAAAERARLQEQRARLESRRQSVMEAIDRLVAADVDPSAVAAALTRRRQWRPTDPQPVAEAIQLADELDAVDADLAALPDQPSPPPSLLADAERELAAAKEAVAAADAALAARQVSPDDAARIDAVHADVLEAEDRAARRLPSPVARKRVKDALHAEHTVLAALGFSSYSDYLLSTSTLIVDPAAPKRAGDAHRRLADAEAVRDELTGGSLRIRREALEEHQVALLKQARDLLGALPDGGVDVATALRELRVHDDGPDADDAALRNALQAAGVAASDALDGDALPDVAERFLADAAEQHVRRAALQAELSTVVDDLESVNAQLSTLAPAPDTTTEVDAALDDARAALTRAQEDEQRAHRAVVDARSTADEHRAAIQRIEALQADLAGARAAEQQTAAHVAHLEAVTAEAEARHEARRRERQAAAERLDAVLDLTAVERVPTEVYLLARVAAQREVGQAGSLPLVVADATTGLSVETTQGVLDVVERFSGVVQFVLMSDDPDIEAWARSFGSDGAAVRRFSFVPAAT